MGFGGMSECGRIGGGMGQRQDDVVNGWMDGRQARTRKGKEGRLTGVTGRVGDASYAFS